mgnify:FL=1
MLKLLIIFVWLLKLFRYIKCKFLNLLSRHYPHNNSQKEQIKYVFIVFFLFGVSSYYVGRTLKYLIDSIGLLDYIKARLWLGTMWDFMIGYYAARWGKYYGEKIDWEIRRRWMRGCECDKLAKYKYKTKLNYDCLCYHQDNELINQLNNINDRYSSEYFCFDE